MRLTFTITHFKFIIHLIMTLLVLSSPAALDRMKNVMMGETKSKRHDLFLANPSDSRLAELVNPSFLGVDNEVLNIVTLQLRETVFTKFFQQADSRLKDMGVVNQFALASMYSLCVLFPETFIHQLEVLLSFYFNTGWKFSYFCVFLDARKEQGGG